MRERSINRRQISMALASAAAAGVLPVRARGEQTYPVRPVRFVLPFAAADQNYVTLDTDGGIKRANGYFQSTLFRSYGIGGYARRRDLYDQTKRRLP